MIRRETLEQDVCVLTFDRPNSSANIFDRATLEELGSHLDVIGSIDTRVRGLVLMSAKDSIFIAGADLHGIRTMSAADVDTFIELGQTVFNKLAALPIPTVAAIHGAALGGGCEIALACDWRLASPDACTKIGLPETKLGLLPAWGGCTRLPRLLGVPAALDLILGGKTLSAGHARKIGLVDEVAPREHFLRVALLRLKRGKRSRQLRHSAPVNAVVDAVIGPRVTRDVEHRTHGHYPAVKKAMEVVMEGASTWNEKESLARERAAIRELLGTASTRSLLNLFFLQERAKKRTVAGVTGRGADITRAAVIGAGVMGSGIVQWLSSRGLRVLLRDIEPAAVALGMERIASLYAAGVKRRIFTAHEARAGLDRVSPAATEVPLMHVDLVIEAAVEKMAVKQQIFRRLDEQVRPDALLATNTSALSITELAGATRHPERVVGIHFFNPVHKMQLVEVVRGRDTSPETAQRALRFVQRLGKLPVLVKDSPGFLVNRILVPYMAEAGRLFEFGARIEDIDGAMLDFGMPMGPLALTDEVGVDIAADVAATLSAAFPGSLTAPAILPRMATAGLLGRKSGKGFFIYRKGGEPGPNHELATSMNADAGGTHFTRPQLERRMVLLMVNEAARCLDEGVVETPDDVDFAMVMGTGWAPFRGGPLRYADSLGTDKVVEELTQLAGEAGPHYLPCTRLEQMAHQQKRFYEE
jgi:3-hydroxyacyl-CoA dehydrogenase/enoyl-CoA hydratase/3-hydroxybutyryl-CoA epimerase